MFLRVRQQIQGKEDGQGVAGERFCGAGSGSDGDQAPRLLSHGSRDLASLSWRTVRREKWGKQAKRPIDKKIGVDDCVART
ncbi:MAG: hypothetical protein RBU37_18780 [Myxococcota bacterium]|jgi:hypothetical protein|nr:hypothetical protein [Myxococcota bacterium]